MTAIVASALLLVGAFVCARSCLRRQPGWEADALLLIWMLAPLGLMTWQSSQVYIHYVLCLVPVPFVVMARGAVWLGRIGLPAPLATIGSRKLVGLLIGAILLVQGATVIAFYAALDAMASAQPHRSRRPTGSGRSTEPTSGAPARHRRAARPAAPLLAKRRRSDPPRGPQRPAPGA